MQINNAYYSLAGVGWGRDNPLLSFPLKWFKERRAAHSKACRHIDKIDFLLDVWCNLDAVKKSIYYLLQTSFINSSSLNKGNYDCDGVWISHVNWHRILRLYFSVFSLALVSIAKIYQTLRTVFDHISKSTSKFVKKKSAAHRIFNSLLGIWKCGQPRSFVFDILRDVTTAVISGPTIMVDKKVLRSTLQNNIRKIQRLSWVSMWCDRRTIDVVVHEILPDI